MSPSSFHGQYDLADMAASFPHPMLIRRLSQWESLENYRSDLSGFDKGPHLLFEGRSDDALLGYRARPQSRAGQGLALHHQRAQVDPRFAPLKVCDLTQPALEGENLHVAREIAAADHVQNHVDPAPAG